MRFVELLVQGIRGFTEKQRIPLDDNRRALRPVSEEQGRVFVHLLRSAFQPSHFEEVAAYLTAPQSPGDAGKFSLIFETDESRWRLVGNTHHGKCILGKWDAASNQYEKVADHDEDIIATLDLEPLLPLLPGYLWSDFSTAETGDDFADDDAFSTPDEIRARLEELQNEKLLMQSVDGVEDDIDVKRRRQFELEDELRKLEERIADFEAAQAELKRTAGMEGVDAILLRKARDWQSHVQRVIDKENQYRDQTEELEDKVRSLEATPVWHKDMIFVGVAAFTLLGFIVPPIIKIYNLALLGFAGLLGGMPWVIWRTRKHLNEVEIQRQHLAALKEESASFSAAEAKDKKVLDTLVKQMQVMDIADLVPLIEKRARLQEKVDDLEKAMTEDRIEARKQEAEAEINQILTNVEAKELQLQDLGTAHTDIRQIDEEIKTLEAKLAAQQGSTPGESAGPLAELVHAGSRFSDTAETFCTQVGGFVNKVLAKVFENADAQVAISPQGTISGYRDALGVSEAAWQTLVHACATLGMARVASTHVQFPVVWNQPFHEIDDTLLASFAGVAARAAGPLPLIVVSERNVFSEPFIDTPLQR